MKPHPFPSVVIRDQEPFRIAFFIPFAFARRMNNPIRTALVADQNGSKRMRQGRRIRRFHVRIAAP